MPLCGESDRVSVQSNVSMSLSVCLSGPLYLSVWVATPMRVCLCV